MLYPRINKSVCKVHHDKVGPTLAAKLLSDAVRVALQSDPGKCCDVTQQQQLSACSRLQHLCVRALAVCARNALFGSVLPLQDNFGVHT